MVDVFGPWISSIPLSSDCTVVQGPNLEPETGSLGTCVEYFVESIQTAHTSLKGVYNIYVHTVEPLSNKDTPEMRTPL